ncbi:MAG: Fe2+-dependent dioxygenase [Hyphomonadaceae bacterium]
MFLEIPEVLNEAEVGRLRELSRQLNFVDGRVSNPANTTKNNLQADVNDPLFKESVSVVANGLSRNETFRNFAFPRRVAPPLLCKYSGGMTYGAHADAAFMVLPNGNYLRSDISCTVWLNDPNTYQGGELVIYLQSRAVPIKCPAGWAVVYPSTQLHEVKPVTSGERLVSITFIESLIPDADKRELVYAVNEVAALEGNTIAWENRMRLQLVAQNLLRMFTT